MTQKLPSSGGSYARVSDDELRQVEATVQSAPRGAHAKPVKKAPAKTETPKKKEA